ncbi:hypothetical protein EC957_004612 [Mortierella hygrophila]|uniref:NACHT domain-containing protein n=1 Tax=Mortierella hygrophila TaxID=979708 RepID=A0A9P6F1D0_9FUNG|nr:hypothetical protein EC957_004612 [Mortierella hygrophila]
MRRSAKSALIEAKRHIDAAEKAQSTKDIIKQYQNAKNILAEVDTKKEDAPSLKDMIGMFLELANVLENKGPATQNRAEKCRQRAAALKQELNRINTIPAAVAMSLLGVPQIAISSLSKCSTTTVTVAYNSATTSPVTSTEKVVSPATFTPQQKPRSTPQATVSLSAAIGSPKAPLLFSKKADRAPFVYHLPAPGEQLETTRQLAYCLALLQDSVDETRLDPDTLKWRRNTLKNSDETIRMETITRKVVTEFIEDREKNAAVVEEVVQLAQVLHKETWRSLLTSFVDTVSESKFLHMDAMEGLARVIPEATPGSIDSSDLVTILQVLYTRLQSIHTPSTSHLCRLLLAVSRVLDAMVVAQVGDVDRITLHGPLTAHLHELESNQDPCVAFQAEYATQALLNVSDNDTIFKAGVRRGWLVLKGAAGFAKMPDPTEIKDALEGLEKLYKAGKGAMRMVNNTWVALKTNEKPEFTVKEGLKFKRIWYPTVRNAEEYIRTGDLVGFKELVTNAPCRHQLNFQLGICQLLGRFAVDDLESRESTLEFLGALCQTNDVWILQKGVKQVIFDMTSILTVNHGTHFEAAKAWQKEMQQRNSALKPPTNLHLHPWNDFLSVNLTGHTTQASTLLMAVQNKKQHKENVEAIQFGVEQIMAQLRPSRSSLRDIQSALKTHYAPDLFIRRISGDELDLMTCFVNLAIVESSAQRKKEKQNLKEQAAVFHRTPSSETIEGSNIQSSIPLERLFDKRKLRDGKENVPKRILVQGRAGIGKTTLCKKLVHEHQNGLWEDRFDAVLWLPLRQLRGTTSRTLESLLREKFFDTQQLDQDQEELARTLTVRAGEGKVLFILDGLDEIATDAQGEGNSLLPLLRTLLGQHHVVITSRPSGLNRLLLPQIDLELETIGFSQQNVKDFVVKVLDPGPARTVQDFIQRAPLIQGLVNIPVQLDVICYCWNSLPMDGSQVTMTRLYQLMVRKLWCKDALRLEKKAEDQVLTEEDVNDLSPEDIDELMTVEMHHLGFLAFKGLVNNHQIEFDHQTLLKTFDDLKDYRKRLRNGNLRSQLLTMLKKTSFLHAADADLDPNKKTSQQTWSFLHLTFQEYFAAIWIASKMTAAGDDGHSLSAGSMKIEPTVRFVQEHKYNPRFEIVWWMVAGLLEGEALSLVDTLRDPEAGVRKSAASALGKQSTLSGPAIQSLIDALQDPDADVRDSAASALGNQSTLSEYAIQFLISALRDKCDEVRRSAASALSNQSTLSESDIQSLVDALLDEYEYVRELAAFALGNQPTLSEYAIQSLISALEDEHEYVREAAASTLHKQSTLSKSAVQSLINAFRNWDRDVREASASILGIQSTLSEPTIQSLISALEDEDKYVRSSAASALGNHSTLSGSAIQSLIGTFEDEDEYARWSEVSALGKQSTLFESVIQSLIGALRGEYAHVKESAALHRQSTLSESVVQPLIGALGDKKADVRRSAASTLGNRSTLSEPTIQSLIGALGDRKSAVRAAAADALGKQSTLSKPTIQFLIGALGDKRAVVRVAAADALGNQSTLSELAVQPLVDTLQDPDAGIRKSAVSALGKQSPLSNPVIQSLIGALQDPDAGVRWSAASALGHHPTLSALDIQPLIDALRDEYKYVRQSAASALGNQSTLSESVIQPLVDTLRDPEADVRKSAASALSKQSTLPEPVIQSLINALQDPDAGIRDSAASALGNQSTLSKYAIQSLIRDVDGLLDLQSIRTRAFSPDRNQLAEGVENFSILLWDLLSGAPGPILKGHTDRLYSLSYSPCGHRLASASWDRFVRLWDLRETEQSFLVAELDLPAESVAFSPSSHDLAFGSFGGTTVNVFDLQSRTLKSFKGLTGQSNTVFVYSPHGQQLAIGTIEKSIHLWDLQSDKPNIVLNAPYGPVYCIAYSSCARWIASCGTSDTVQLWHRQPSEPESWSFVTSVRGFFADVMDIAWNTVVPMEFGTGCADGSVRAWRISSDGDGEGFVVKLLWGPNLSILCANGLALKDATGLSPINQKLLVQRGAIDDV